MIGLTNSWEGFTMKELAVYEAKTRFSELLVEVEQGEQVTITRRGQAVARLVPMATGKRAAVSQKQQVQATFAALKVLRQGVRLEGDVKDLIAAGRD